MLSDRDDESSDDGSQFADLPWSLTSCWDAINRASSVQFLFVEISGKVLHSNREAGKPFVGQSVHDFLPPDLRECFTASVRGEFRQFTTSDGIFPGTFDTRFSPIREGEKVVGVLMTFADVTTQFEVQAALRRSEEKWKSLANNAVDHIILIDLQGNILDINRTIPGTDVDEVVGTSALNYIPSEFQQMFRDALAKMIETGEMQTYEIQGADGVGGVTWFSSRMVPFIQDEQLIGAIIFAVGIADRKIVEEKLRKERKLLRDLLDLQDQERQLLSYDIHDGFVQDVVGAQLLFESIYEQMLNANPKSLPQLIRMSNLLRKAIDEGRSLISNLRPPILDERGLIDALAYLVVEENVGELDIEFYHDVRFSRLERPLEGTIYRIVQEALNNTKRHSGASVANISVTEADGIMSIDVADNGSGFALDEVPEDRYGLKGIQERARLFGGAARIDSNQDGTTIHVELPLHPDKQHQD